MNSTPVDLSFSYLRSAVEASLNRKKVQVEPNTHHTFFSIILHVNSVLSVMCIFGGRRGDKGQRGVGEGWCEPDFENKENTDSRSTFEGFFLPWLVFSVW